MPTQVTLNESTTYTHQSDDPKEAEQDARSGSKNAKAVKYTGSWATAPIVPVSTATTQNVLQHKTTTTTTAPTGTTGGVQLPAQPAPVVTGEPAA